MPLIGAIWGFGVLVVLVLIVACAIVGWDRYRPRHGTGSARTHPTDEVFLDPETGRRMRVWFDPVSGTRDYRPD